MILRADRREERRREAQRRNEAWRALTPSEQLADLNLRLGDGAGAKRQRERLANTKPVPAAKEK